MDYEKKYNEALERARALWQEAIEKEYPNDYLKDYETIFPELRESEDERIRRTLVEYFGPKVQLDFVRGVPIQKIRDWLEKQKEQKPLEAPSPSVIYTEQGEVLAEQKPVEKQDYSGLNDLERAVLRGFLCAGVENVPVGIIKDTAAECIVFLALIEPKPSWSEKDEEMLRSIIEDVTPVGECPDYPTDDEREYYYNGQDKTNWLKDLPNRFNLQPKQEWSEEDEKMLTGIIERGSVQVPPYTTALREEQIEWLMNRLKSLRPGWKPTEEQMEALNAMNCCGELSYQGQQQLLIDLYQQLKKLM